MSENVKVMIRCRPFLHDQISQNSIIQIDEDFHQITMSRIKSSQEQQKVFTFDHVFNSQDSQQFVYENSSFLLVENVLEGYNGTVLAYGQTGCGKTFTMSGTQVQNEQGIIPRSFKQIMTRAGSQKEKRFLIHCSYIQIYNEDVYDLFDKKNRTKLQVKQAPGKGTFIKDQKLQIVKSTQQIIKLFEMGSRNRAIRQTSFNKNSSRSHCIFTVHIQSVQQTEEANQLFKVGKLNLVDLAGSQRQSKLKMFGLGLKQTTRINLSLSALGNVISSLIDGRSSHIPYRDSKLTRILQDSLGGNTKTVMIATISPCESSFEQTLSTLRYASRTKYIKNKPIVNEDPKDTLLRQYAEEIKRLKSILAQIDPTLLVGGIKQKQVNVEESSINLEAYEKQKQELKRKIESLENILQKQEIQQDSNELQKIVRLKEKLKQKEWKLEVYNEEKKKREQELLTLQTHYQSLNEEVDELRKRFQDVRSKYVQAQQEIKDLKYQYGIQKQQLLSNLRNQEANLSKYKGILDNIMTDKQIQQIVSRSKFNEEDILWTITPFLFKENTLIFPQVGIRSMRDVLQREKEKINMFVSEDTRKQYLQKRLKQQNLFSNKFKRNTFGSGITSHQQVLNKRNSSLSSLYSGKTNQNVAKVTVNPIVKDKKPVGSLIPLNTYNSLGSGPDKKLDIDVNKLKMDILAELGKNRSSRGS